MTFDVRVLRSDFKLLDGELAIETHLRIISFEAPAAGPEIELTFGDWPDEQALAEFLAGKGFTVLAMRERQ